MSEEISDVKFAEVEAMVRQYKEERDEYEAKQKEADDLKKICNNTSMRILSFLSHFKLKSHKTLYGTVTRKEKFTVKTPKTDTDRSAFREFLESRGTFNDLWSVNSNTLNSRAKEWFEQAFEEGNTDFVIPGIGEPTYSEIFAFRRK